ncbi:helix-turn-helix domain-containing protein [Halorussus gelatinilyticus]|uniref:Helix-turn-helix domain-containing protein n=1 Tax=Halorussus gelatinilyticus TaxID=2937524 RepID=A0A8U0IG10_9EURY|nr:helix-turn-helix domain-containing protein [Halorussus gelatinilyticus]UPW00027.1 helix-turn-helix domain-containing protein [Halorussus gelatinilyticus]
MSVMAEMTVPASEFVLADTLTKAPGMRIEIKRVVAGTEHVTPYFWAANGDFEGFEDALREDSTIRDILTLEEQEGDERFYRVTWQADVETLMSGISDAKATILEAVSDGGEQWELKVLFPDRDALSAFHDYCLEREFSFRLDRVYQPENPEESGSYGVTEEQREALIAAYDAGYFDVPRGAKLAGLAEDLGISRNALSARLRRGNRNLLANTLVHDE